MKNTDTTNSSQLNRRSWLGRMTAVTLGTVLGGAIARGSSPLPVSPKTKSTQTARKRAARESIPMGYDEPMF